MRFGARISDQIQAKVLCDILDNYTETCAPHHAFLRLLLARRPRRTSSTPEGASRKRADQIGFGLVRLSQSAHQ